jgi:hypothetical protein
MGLADTLIEQLPLRVMLDCLQVRLSSPDPRRAPQLAAELLRRELDETPSGDQTWDGLAASLRCRELLRSDPGPLRDAVAHYRSLGPPVQLPAALEDLAAVLAQRGQEDEAKAALNEAVSLYENLDARWDIRRADSWLRAYSIRRGVRGRRGPRAASGWEALTPTELKIAAMMAGGTSTPDIARGHVLVPTYCANPHVAHPRQAGAKGRVDIVREALRQGISA